MTFVIETDIALTDPAPGLQPIPLPFSDFLLRWRASDLVGIVDQGAPITSWVGQGTADIALRTLGVVLPEWTGPKLQMVGGRPVVEFTGSNHIGHGSVLFTSIPQPSTWVLVFQNGRFVESSVQRLIAGNTSQYQNIEPRVAGYSMRAGPGFYLNTGNLNTGRQVIVAVFDGAESKMLFNDGPIYIGNPGPLGFRGLNIGAASAATPAQAASNSGLIGLGEEVGMFSYAMSDTYMRQIAYLKMQEYGISPQI